MWAFLIQIGSVFRFALKGLAQSLLLAIVKALYLCQLVAGKD
jgi:hypothetical protein